MTGPEESESDTWVLKHINVSHVQPIIEAIDLDGSGFISVQEANKFALSRPKGMKCVAVFLRIVCCLTTRKIFTLDGILGSW